MKIVKYALIVEQMLSSFSKKSPLTWFKVLWEYLKNKPVESPIISNRRRKPLLFPTELNTKRRFFIRNMGTAGGTIRKHAIYGILTGLTKIDMTKYGGYLDFVITKGRIQSLYNKMNMSQGMVTTFQPVVASLLWEEVWTQFNNDIA